MQQNHTPRRQLRSRQVDGFIRPRIRHQPTYVRRSNVILPATDDEYVAAMTGRVLPRNPEPTAPGQRTVKAATDKFRNRRKVSNPSLSRKWATGLVLLTLSVLTVVNVATSRDAPRVTADEDLRQVLQDNGDTPHSKQPYNHLNFQTAPDLPKLLTIQKIGVNARVTRLSARENSEPKSPSSIYDVGWYENSAKPGETGAALLIGHIRGHEKSGVFYDLTRLTPGDEFQLETGDGKIQNYQVIKMEAYPRGQVDFAALMQSALDDRPGLNLLTAVGAYESNASVTQQLAVFAVEKALSSNGNGSTEQTLPNL